MSRHHIYKSLSADEFMEHFAFALSHSGYYALGLNCIQDIFKHILKMNIMNKYTTFWKNTAKYWLYILECWHH